MENRISAAITRPAVAAFAKGQVWKVGDVNLAVTLVGKTLVYLLRHKSRQAATEAWAKFTADPEWVALKAATEKDGAFVTVHDVTFLKLTDFSPKV